MKKFFKTTFACVLGTLIAGLILVLIFTVTLVGITASSVTSQEKPYISKANTVLKINLSGTLQERYEEDVNLDPMTLLNQGGDSESIGLDQIRKALETAANDNNIVGIYLNAEGISAMPASIEQVRNMLVEF